MRGHADHPDHLAATVAVIGKDVDTVGLQLTGDAARVDRAREPVAYRNRPTLATRLPNYHTGRSRCDLSARV
jgi:hypothetical protein